MRGCKTINIGTMIKAIYIKDSVACTETQVENLPRILTEQNLKLFWLDITVEEQELTQAEISLLADIFKIHELSIEDCIFPQYHPKVEEFENYIFVALHGIKTSIKDYLDFEKHIFELDIILGKNYIITVHTDELPFIESIYEKARIKPQVEMKSTENLLFSFFHKVVISYEVIMDKINDKIDDIEDHVLKNPSTALMHEIFSLKKVLLHMRKIIEPQKHVYVYFTRETQSFIAKKYVAYFRDIFFQYDRNSQAIAAYNQVIGSMLEVYLSGVTLKLNEVIKFLTVIATIFMPAVLITSYYGMNVAFPEHKIFGNAKVWYFAFFVIIASTIGIYTYIRKKKWF